MTRLKGIFIIIIIYIVFNLSIFLKLDILYPYFFLKDIMTYPVKALTVDSNVSFSNDFNNGINLGLKDEIDNLKKLTGIKTVLGEFDCVNATIISRNREYWFNNITIDKGINDGVHEDFAVVDSGGLIGRVDKVRNNSSDIKLITTNDNNNKISVLIKSNNKNVYGITNGYDTLDKHLEVILFSHDEIQNNSMVYTTGMGGVFPSGILIGKVDFVQKDNDGVSLIAKVSLSSNIEGDKYVSILKREKISDS